MPGAIAFQTYRVGELGSKIVYNPDGNVDFGATDCHVSTRAGQVLSVSIGRMPAAV